MYAYAIAGGTGGAKVKILLFGGTGMLGHVVKIILEEAGHDVFAPTRDIYDVTMGKDALRELIYSYDPSYVINCIGVLVKESNDNPDIAKLVNSSFPHWIEEMVDPFKVIHASTDCVFSGDLLCPLTYSETDNKDASTVYGRSKAEGEITGTVRTSIIGPELKNGTNLFHWFVNSKGKVNGYSDHFWNGITTLEWARQALRIIEREERFGLIQMGLKRPVRKDELLSYIKDIFNLDVSIVSCVAGHCNRVLRSSVEVPHIRQQIDEMRNFMLDHIGIYEQYKEVLGV